MVNEQEELPEEEEDEFAGINDFTESYEGDNNDIMGIYETNCDGIGDLENIGENLEEDENDIEGIGTLDGEESQDQVPSGAEGGGSEASGKSGGGEGLYDNLNIREFTPDNKIKKLFKYFKE